MLRRSIGTKRTIWYTGILCLTFFLLGSVTYGLLAYSLSRDMDDALNGVAELMVQQAGDEGNGLFPPDVDELFRRFFGFSPLEHQIDIFNSHGQLERQQKMKNQSPDIPLTRLSLFAPPASRNYLIFRYRPQKVGTTWYFPTQQLQRQFVVEAAWAKSI